MPKYNTRTKDIINSEIKNFPNGFTIKELKEYFDNKNYKIGLTTIYRLINELEENNVVKKYYDENNVAHYKFTKDCVSEHHFYLKCVKCNTITHIDCGCINEFQNHILKKHKFLLDSKNIILEGLCNKCRSFVIF